MPARYRVTCPLCKVPINARNWKRHWRRRHATDNPHLVMERAPRGRGLVWRLRGAILKTIHYACNLYEPPSLSLTYELTT